MAGMEPNKRFEIQLSHVCNNRCVFCVSGQMTQLRRTKPTPEEEIKDALTQARERGMTKATIMGGEPTIHVTFLPALKHAVELGFEEIEIFTNGSRFQQREFIDRVLAVGRNFVWRISIQGWDEETHDLTTQKPGAFRKIVQGLEYLAEQGQKITCNMCVVEQNYRSLSKLPDFVVKYAIRQVHLDMIRPADAGDRTEDYLVGLLPDYAELGRITREMFERLDQVAPTLDVNVGNLPYCQAPEWAHRIHHGGNETFTVAAEGEGQVSKPWNKYLVKKRDKVKLESCHNCTFERHCDGFFELYALRKGVEIFKPVSRTALRQLDPTQRTFVHQLGPACIQLKRAKVPGWTLASTDDSEFDRWIRFRYVQESGGTAELLLLPIDSQGGGDGEHEEFLLRLDASKGVEETELAALTRRVFEELCGPLGGTIKAAPTLERIRARRKVSGPESPVPLPVQKSLQSLLAASPLAGGWRIRGASATLNPLGAIVRLVNGTSGAILRLTHVDGVLRGSWDFESGGDPRSHQLLAKAVAGVLARTREQSAAAG